MNSRVLVYATIVFFALTFSAAGLHAQRAQSDSDQQTHKTTQSNKIRKQKPSRGTGNEKRKGKPTPKNRGSKASAQQRAAVGKLKTHEGVQGTLWVQSSLEYQMVCKQTYALATLRLKSNLADKSFSAALEQHGDYTKLPPAVILDIDETALDNSPFQARMVKNDGVFIPEEWAQWVNQAEASAVPGAAEFIKSAKRLGVEVIFVTNRSVDTEVKTIQNLKDVFGIDVHKDQIHCKNERPDWTSNKNTRRSYVCQSFRVIGLIGDDYNDFAWIGKTSPQDRKAIGGQFQEHWGRDWFLLPNPLYGNWDKATYDYDYQKSRREVLDMKYQLLETKD